MAGEKVLLAAEGIFGHAVPILVAASAFRDAGHEVLVACWEDHVRHSVEPRLRQLLSAHRIAFTIMPSKPGMEMATDAIGLLGRYGPDITVCDGCFAMWTALRAWRPRCSISIARCNIILDYVRQNPLLGEKFGVSDLEKVDQVNAFVQRNGSTRFVDDLRELCAADVMAIPSVPEIDPLPSSLAKNYAASSFVYTGPLLLPIGERAPAPVTAWMAAHRAAGTPVVLVTLGTVWGSEVYAHLADGLSDSGLAAVMVIPYEPERRRLAARAGPSLQVIGVTDLSEVAAASDIVVHHCGHGTLHTVLLAGKPSITLPSGEYDREDDALRLEDLACGRHLGHDFFRRGFRREAMVAAIKAVLQDQTIRAGTLQMQRIEREYAERRNTVGLAKLLLEPVLQAGPRGCAPRAHKGLESDAQPSR